MVVNEACLQAGTCWSGNPTKLTNPDENTRILVKEAIPSTRIMFWSIHRIEVLVEPLIQRLWGI